ncbi:unnamed protein product [Dicrocoelium dendriticum]|nr:unnamed protein product [Dicrocoelium dendriticum]
MQNRRRLFIANVDRYDEYYIGKLLSETLTGSSVKQEENEALEESESLAEGAKQGETYEIFGTLSKSEAVPPSFVNEVFPSGRRKELYEAVVNCDFILYNIKDDPEMVDEALWMVEKIHENIAQLQTQKLFILLSSVLTWAKSAFPDENDPELPFADEDYRKRKPHHNFRDHIQVEKSTIHYGKTDKLKLLTYVVASGATYGEKQNVFHYFFKNAWNNDQFLHVLEDGQNILPTIHVNDLAKIIQTVIELRPTKHYIIAKDDSQNTLYEIVKGGYTPPAGYSGESNHLRHTY